MVLVAEPASATILFAGSEDLDFTGVGATIWAYTGGCYNSTYAREGVVSSQQNGAYYVATPVFTSSSTFWTHFDWGSCSGNSECNNAPLVEFLDSSGVVRLYIIFSGCGANPSQTIKLTKKMRPKPVHC